VPDTGISVGDAIVSFLADTTQLDLAFDKAEANAQEKLTPVSEKLQEVAGNWQFAGETATTAGEEAEVAGDEFVDAAEKTRASSYEARGELALLGEETGVRLPRHVRSFVAELPGVAPALSAAFSATAVLFLIEALVQGTEKLSSWISSTFIYTQAMKDADAEIAKTNKSILEQKDAFDKAQQAMEAFGLTGADLTQHKLDDLTSEIQKNQEAFIGAEQTMAAYRHGLDDVTEASYNAAAAQAKILKATLEAQNEQLKLLQAQHDREQTDEIIKAEQQKIAERKAGAEARLALDEQYNRIFIAATKSTADQEAAIAAESEQKRYQIELQALQEQLTLTQFMGKGEAQEREKILSQIEVLETNHKAKLVQTYADLMANLRQITSEPIPLITSTIDDNISSKNVEDLEDAQRAAQALGFTFSGDLKNALQQAENAYFELSHSGVQSTSDLLQAQMRLLQLQIQAKELNGENASAEVRDLQKIEREYDRLTGSVTRTHKATHDFFAQLQIDLRHGVDGMQQLRDIGGEAFNDLSKSLESAVASAILGQQSFGAALEQATAQALASIAAQALVKALFYTGEGFAALAGFADESAANYFAAAAIMGGIGGVAAAAAHGLSGGGSSTSGASKSATGNVSSPATQAAPQPHNVQTVQHFAAGGLITGPTLAVLGDSNRSSGGQREAAIPLDDPQAVHAIVEALGGGRGPQIVVNVKGMISDDNLGKVVQKISRRVNKGQSHLKASDSFRYTKRSL
jgi:hypothetical protein